MRRDDTALMMSTREVMVNGITHANYYGSEEVRVEFRSNSLTVRNQGCFTSQVGGIRKPFRSQEPKRNEDADTHRTNEEYPEQSLPCGGGIHGDGAQDADDHEDNQPFHRDDVH